MEINSFKFKKPKLPGPLYEEDRQPKAETWKPESFSDVSESILASIGNVNAPSVPSRIDFIVDKYLDDSIKNAECQRRSQPSEGRSITN